MNQEIFLMMKDEAYTYDELSFLAEKVLPFIGIDGSMKYIILNLRKKFSFLSKIISYFTYDVSKVFDIMKVLKTYSENGVKKYVNRS